MDELVAKIGSAFLSADLEITPGIRKDHMSYLAVRLKVLENDKRAIFDAAAHAERAATYLHEIQPTVPAIECDPSDLSEDRCVAPRPS